MNYENRIVCFLDLLGFGDHIRKDTINKDGEDTDGWYFIDYITKAQGELDDPYFDHPDYLNKLRNLIAKGLRSQNPSIRNKYEWMRNKFVPYLKEIRSNTDPIDGIGGLYHLIPDL